MSRRASRHRYLFDRPSRGEISNVGTAGRTLVIEDDDVTRGLFLELLMDSGIPASSAGFDALPEPDEFRVVLTDLPLARRGYSSSAATEWVRLLRDRYGAAVIVATGHSEALHDGDLVGLAYAVIGKPISIDALTATVAAAAHAEV